MTDTKSKPNMWVWGFTIVLALLFFAGAAGKLSGNAQAVENFHRWGLDDNFRLFVGVAELVGAIGLLFPFSATLAATGLAVIMVGASFVHLSHGEAPMVLLTATVLCLLLFVAYARRSAIGSLLGAEAAH